MFSFISDRLPRVKTYNLMISVIFMTIVIICFLHFAFDIEVQKSVVISGIMVFGFKVTSSVLDIIC